ncbi:HelD family protein [Alkalicoccobacillus murimartini]|uniref:DNA helicase-2/ATP-dependent DNA helicase PcrA n=1 Tax=Alkalicoccobacillus murimartini TaxID=171685 RepID=A0ABT9YIT6_9BACI|nr:UvrD-helicase domain-containing protein [Alkalicoccobacillus murimartini]MDQ0207626.1 DNA helicase-2/ATP-dependent DNA helicase PcrA [Alkalicoccobacillus murimartini]
MSDSFHEEKQTLEQKLRQIHSYGEVLEEMPRYRGDDFNEQVLEDSRERQRQIIKKATQEPYFGRLDFKEYSQTEPIPLYIGKAGVHEEKTGEVLVVDWRAPVSSLFYAFSGSEEDVYYVAPEGMIDGTIELKRNIMIREQELQRVVDSYKQGESTSSGGDEFLLYKLGEQKDNRLQDIVSTIQGEQNEIIRHPQNKAVIIQGVAGSGKTTVALHRLAYLLYEYREQMQAENMIIFAPNAMFLDYISQVLPELGVGHIQQTTFNEWALEKLNDPAIQLANQTNKLQNRFELDQPSVDHATQYKGSVEFQTDVEQELRHLEDSSFPTEDFEAWEGAVISNETLVTWRTIDFQDSPFRVKHERIKARMKRWIEIEVKQLFLDKKEQEELRKHAMANLRKFLARIKKRTAFQLYNHILKSKKMPLQDNLVEPEDLAPLLHIHHKWIGLEKDQRFDHVVIDEAQDFSPYQIAVLQEQTRGQSFTILGDLSQGIHSVQGIDQWSSFEHLFGERKTAYFEMNKSYRSTYEIIECANHILKQFPQRRVLAEPVFRSGEPVSIHHVAQQNMVQEVQNWITSMREKGFQTIAVIGRTHDHCSGLYEDLIGVNKELTFIQAEDDTYKGGTSILPVYLSKGLEFDAVLLLQVDEQSYQHIPEHVKLLYVGATRALHRLDMFYSKQITPLLKDYSVSQ